MISQLSQTLPKRTIPRGKSIPGTLECSTSGDPFIEFLKILEKSGLFQKKTLGVSDLHSGTHVSINRRNICGGTRAEL